MNQTNQQFYVCLCHAFSRCCSSSRDGCVNRQIHFTAKYISFSVGDRSQTKNRLFTGFDFFPCNPPERIFAHEAPDAHEACTNSCFLSTVQSNSIRLYQLSMHTVYAVELMQSLSSFGLVCKNKKYLFMCVLSFMMVARVPLHAAVGCAQRALEVMKKKLFSLLSIIISDDVFIVIAPIFYYNISRR